MAASRWARSRSEAARTGLGLGALAVLGDDALSGPSGRELAGELVELAIEETTMISSPSGSSHPPSWLVIEAPVGERDPRAR